MKKLFANWQTSVSGISMICLAVLHLIFQMRAHVADESAWTVAVLAVLGGIGLIAAGDANKSATVVQVDHLQQQIKEIPAAIKSGDTDLLTKTINKPEVPPTP